MAQHRNQGPTPARRDGLWTKAVNPADGTLFDVEISYRRLQNLPRRGRGAVLKTAYVVPSVLSAPVAVFAGLRRDADEDDRSAGWLCYCGVPDRAYRADGEQVPP